MVAFTDPNDLLSYRLPPNDTAIVGTDTHPWGSAQVLLPLLGGLALLVLMVWIEARTDSPLIPLEFFKNRTRVVTNFTTLFFSSAFFSYFFLLTLFEQQILGYSPLKGGLSYLPFGLSIGAGHDPAIGGKGSRTGCRDGQR